MRKRVRLPFPELSSVEGLDLVARKIVMSSILYYGLDEPLLSDAQFDAWCLKLSKLWFRLDPFRQWQLGSRDDIKTSGYQVKVTQAAVGGSIAWLEAQAKLMGRRVETVRPWQWSKRHQVHWLLPTDFRWVTETKKKRVRL